MIVCLIPQTLALLRAHKHRLERFHQRPYKITFKCLKWNKIERLIEWHCPFVFYKHSTVFLNSYLSWMIIMISIITRFLPVNASRIKGLIQIQRYNKTYFIIKEASVYKKLAIICSLHILSRPAEKLLLRTMCTI